MSNATNLSKLANLLDDGTSGQALVSDGASNVAFETLSTSNVSEGTNLYFTDERVQTKLGSVSGNVVPDTNVAYDLGSAAYAFKDLYLSGSTISLGSLQLSDNGGSLEVSPAGGGSAEPFATETYVTTQVNNLVDAAPGTLDTLNELAAALGDDANFSTTVTNSIAAKANTASLATVATSGSFSDLTNKPTTIAGYGITDAGSGGGGNVVEYTSTNTAATNDIVMLNSDGTVTVVEPTNYPFDQQTAIDSQMTSGYIGDLNYRGMIAHHSTREKGMLIFPGGTGHNDRTMLVVFSRNGSGISKGTAFSSGEPISNFRDQHAFFGPAGTHEDKFLYLGAATSGGNINVGTGNITGTTVNTTGTDSSAAYSNTTNNGQLNIGLNGRMVVDHGGFNGTVLTFYVKFENSNNKAAVRKFTYDFANQNLDYSFPEIETSSSETFEWEHTAIDPSTPTRIALYRQEGVTSTRRGIIKFADVDWNAGTINIGPSADLFTRSGSHNVDAYEIQNKQAFHPTNGLLAAVTTSPADGGGDAPYRLKVALYSADANLSITNVSGNLTLMNGANVKVGTVLGNIAWTKGSNTGSTPNAPILITPIISNQTGSSPQTRYLQYDNSGNYITQTTDSNTFDSGSMWTYSSPFNDGDTASYSPDTVNSLYPQVIMTQGPYGESNFDATKLHGVAASAGTTIDVTLEYGIHTGLSGLTTGTRYFVTDSGGISTSGSAKLGTAINATSLALDFTDELTSTDLGTYATKSYVGTEIAIKANTADLSTVATSGSYNDLTNQPTIPTNNNQLTNGAGFITAADVSNPNTVEYTSTSSASVDDVVMLNTDGTVTPVEVTTFPTTVNGSAPEIVPSSTRLAGSTNDGTVVGDAPHHLFKLDGNKYLSVGRHEGGASGFYGVYSAVAEYNSGSWNWGTVYDMNNTNWGTVNWNSEYYNDPYVLRSPDNPDKFLFFKLRTGGSFAAIIGTVNGLTISWSDYSQPSQNYPSSINNQYNVRTEYDYAGSSAGNYKFIVWYGASSDMKAFRVVWDGDTTITWEDEVTISTGGSGAVPNGNINPVSASFSRVTEGRLCVHNYTVGSLQVYDIDWVNGTTQVGNNFSITASSSTDGTSNYYGVDVKTAWNPLTDEVISINRLASGNPNIRFRRYSVDATRTITANGVEFSPNGWYISSTYWLNGDLKFFPKSNVMFFSHARKDGTYDSHFIHYLATDNSNSFTQVYGIEAGSSSSLNWPFSARMYPDPFSSGQGSMSYTDRSSGVSRLEGKPIQGEYVESNLDKSKIHGIAATSGTTPDVTTQFGVHSGLSGLTVGSKYYVLDDGTLSTTPDTHNAKIGVAVKSTHIALDFIDELTESDLTTYATKSYVATQTFSGNYNDLTNQPTIPANTSQLVNNSGFITAADVPNTNTIEYTSTSSASVDDVVMLNTDGTVTPVEVTTYPEQITNQGYNGSYQQLLPNSEGYTISNTNGLVAAGKGYWLFSTQTDNKYISVAFDEAPGSIFEMKIVSAEYNSSNETWTYGTEYQDLASLGNSLGLATSDNPYVIGSPDNPDKFLILGPKKNGGSSDLIIHAIGTMGGSGITWSDTGTNSSNSGPTYNSRLDHINWYYDHAGSTAGSYKIIGAYRDNSSNCRIFRITWDGNTTIQYSDDFAIPHTIDSRSLDFSKLTEGRFAGVDTSGNLRIGDIDWGTGNITVGTAYGLSSFNTNYGTDAPAHVAWRDSSEHFVVAWSVGGGSNSLKLRAFSTTGNSAVAEGSEYSLGYNQGGTYGHLSGNMAFYKNSNMFALTNAGYYYLNNTSNGRDGSFITHFSVNSYLNIVIGTSRVTHGSNYYAKNTGFGYPGKIQMDPFRSGKGSISAAGNTDANNLVVKLFAQPTQGVYIESNLDASKVHGIAASAGTTIDVTVEGGIHTGLSGLTAGSKHYVLSDGSLSATPDTNNAKVGLAMSSTALAIDLLDELTDASLATYATKAYVGTEIAIKANTADLSTVATSGSYNDLTNQPTIPSLTGYATETYVNTATANLVDSAPATLDTLNELAAALGDDANFSTTILAQLGTVSANTISNASNINAVQANLSASASTAAVTVSGGNFYIDGAQQATISLEPGRTYKFDQSDSTNSSHPLRFSTTSDGTHGGGSEYTTGVTTSGTAGSASAYVQIAVDNSTPALYYYCTNHSGMGAAVSVGNPFNTNELTEGTSNLYYTDARVDAHISANVALADLNNVSNTAPADGQALIWNTSQSNWAPANVASGGSSVSVSDTAPSSPSNGDQWFNSADGSMYIYYADGSSNQWVSVSGPAGSSVSVGTTPPTGAANGDQWFNSDSATLYVYYADGSSSQWVAVSGPRGPAGTGVSTGKAIAMSIVFG